MEDAASALDKARKHAEAGQDSVALRLCSISLRLHETAEARELKEWIENWGADSPAGLKARSVLSANNYYEIFGVQYLAPYPINGLKKIYYTLSRDLHPDKSKAKGAEDAFKLVGQAHTTLTDEYQKQCYDAKLQGLPKPAKPAGYGEPAASPAQRRSPRSQPQQQQDQQDQQERMKAASECADILRSLKGALLKYICERINVTKSGNVTDLKIRLSSHFQAVAAGNPDPQFGLRQLRQLVSEFES